MRGASRPRVTTRRRLVLVAIAVGLLMSGSLAACSQTSGLRVGLAFAVGGPGDHGFNDAALAGLNRAERDLHSVIAVRALSARNNETEDDQYERLALLCTAGFNPVIAVGFTYAGVDPASGPLARASRTCPTTRFAIVDSGQVLEPNVANLVFADEQGAYLMGVAAAAKTRTGTVGIVGACPNAVIERFRAGYLSGAEAQRPSINVDTEYLSTDPNRCDFTNTDAARTAAGSLYNAGADVIFQVAGGAGIGVFEAASAHRTMAIGVDSDQYVTVGRPLNRVIITSEVKHVDLAVVDFIESVAHGSFRSGVHRYDLADDGITFATSGGQIDDIETTLQKDRNAIIAGHIIVPTAR